MAENIASKSPVAVWALKKSFNFNKKPLFMRGLDYIKNVNLTALNTEVSMNNIDK